MRIAVFGDAHYCSMRTQRAKARANRDLYYAHFLDFFFKQAADLYISLGDLTNFGFKAEFEQIYTLLNQYDKPFYQIMGNHDVYRYSKIEVQQMTKMPLYKVIEYETVRVILLDTNLVRHYWSMNGAMDYYQYHFLELNLQKTDKFLVVFGHHPAHSVDILDESGQRMPDLNLKKVLLNYAGSAMYINGHLHKDILYKQQNWIKYQIADILSAPYVHIIDIQPNQLTLESRILPKEEHRHLAKRVAINVKSYPTKVRNYYTIPVALTRYDLDPKTHQFVDQHSIETHKILSLPSPKALKRKKETV